MTSLIETLNRWGGRIPDFAWPMLWQSSVLIAVLFVFDFVARRKVRASIRYALWLVVLVKLLLPPTLALPTSLAWWVRPPAPQPRAQARTTAFVVTYGDFVPANLPTPAPPVFVPPPKPYLSGAGQAAATWAVVGAGLLVWLVVRWRQVAGNVRQAAVAPALLNEVLDEPQQGIKVARRVRLLVTNRAMSPAVCGLFRPVILLPNSLVERLTPSQLRAVLLHELTHLRRGDVWVNCAQALLQIFYWWHPLLWLANARIRRVREEAVDDAVMLALCDDAETYALTLVEVAKLAFNRPLASLGLVGIMESRSALRQRIERLVDFRPPRKAGLTIASALCVLAFAVLAVPMEQAPATSATQQTESASPPVEVSNENEEVKLRMIVLNKPVAGDAAEIRKLAEDIIAKVKGGAAFSEMASVFSEGRQGREGGDWGWVQKYDRDGALVLRKELADVAFSLKPGELSGIIETPEVIYLMLVEDKRPVDIKSPSAQDRKPLTGVNQAVGLTNSRPEAITNKVPLLGDIPLVGRLFRTDSATATNGAFSNALPKSLYEGTRGPQYAFSGKYYQVELREDGSYWAAGKRMNLEELRDWLVKTKQSGSSPSIGFQVKSNAAPEAVRALAELRTELGLAEGAALQSPSSSSAEQLYTRTFQVDPKALYERLENAIGISHDDLGSGSGQGGALILPGVDPQEQARIRNPRTLSPDLPQVRDRGGLSFITRTNRMQAVSVAMATFFNALGVDFASPNALALGKAIFWNDRSGTLLVRATKQDLDTIEVGIESLMAAPDRNIEAERGAVVSPTNALFTPTLPKNTQPIATATNAALETRLYRLVAPAFLKNLQRQISESPNAPIQQIITNYLASSGVNLQPPNLLVFNERNGTFVVRASLLQHELLEQLVQQLNAIPAQINIKVRFVEIEQSDTKASRFDWNLGNLLMSNAAFTNSLGKPLSPFHGILTDPQYRVILRALEQRNGVDLLTAPEITTVSGRQAQIAVVELRTIVNAVNLPVPIPPGTVSTNSPTNSVYQTQTLPLGPTLDVIPHIAADGYTIQMKVTATVTEFLGYDGSATYWPTNSIGLAKQPVLPLPQFRVRQMTVTANVRDGQTLVLGNPTVTEILKKPDGRTETKDVSDTQKKQLVVFITPTLVDETGNRLYSDDKPVPAPK
jgi:beta-lactamase regulating signal transducer with metallopeptidase domain/type II secretory pathway component GspD/PulD (secretin)